METIVPPNKFITVAAPTSAADVLEWPITSRLETIQTGERIHFPHSKSGVWPSNVIGMFDAANPVEGNLWAICYVDGTWVAGTIDWVRPGQIDKVRPAAEYGPCWKAGYDDYTGPVASELVGYFVSTMARFGERSAINERSNIVWTRFGTSEIVAVEAQAGNMTIQETLAQVRGKYTYDQTKGPTEDQCAAICNETAWIHRNDPERWGVSTKTNGSFGTLSDGSQVAVDIIQNGVTREAFDCLYAAGFDPVTQKYGPAAPVWNSVGVITDPARPWKAPIDPGTTPPDPPDPPYPPQPPVNGYATAEALAKHDAEIKAALQTLGASLPALVPVLTNTLKAMLAATEFEGTAKILGMTVRFTLKPKVAGIS